MTTVLLGEKATIAGSPIPVDYVRLL